MRNILIVIIALLVAACGTTAAPTITAPTATPTTAAPTTAAPTDEPTVTVPAATTAAPTSSALPDLDVERAQNSLEPHNCFSALSRMAIVVIITNHGEADSGAFEVDVNGQIIAGESLAPDESVMLQADYGLSITQIDVEVDPQNTIAESDESNNTFTGVVLTMTPPVPCTPTPTP